MTDVEKKVDQSWKDQVQKEKSQDLEAQDALSDNGDMEFPEANFLTFLSSLAFQCLIFLGVMPNPVTKKVEPDIAQARYLIDTLHVLKEKTQGNLSSEESKQFDALLYDLRVKFVEATQKPA